MRIRLLDFEVPVSSPEDTVLTKLEWYRKGAETSQRQWEDVSGLVRVQGTRLDRAYLSVICERFDGGPVGIEAVAASLSEERGTLEEVVEPFLLQVGFIARTPRGRIATAAGYHHMGMAPPAKAPTGGGAQGRLF